MKQAIHRDETGHIVPKEQRPYNERLFTGGLRGWLHTARFRWLRKTMQQLHITGGTVLELGSFDGKTIGYLPFTPAIYTGYDADWEDGLALANKRWAQHANYSFTKSTEPQTFNAGNRQYNYTIAMETMEHLPAHELPAYMEKLRIATRDYLFITIPVEKGPVAAGKYLAKKIFLKADEGYTAGEWWHALTGNLQKVERVELGHKGFDYSDFINKLSTYFEVIRVDGIPFGMLPPVLNFSVGILTKPRK
jgi:hypothetical protein